MLWWQADQAQRDRWQDRSGRLNPLRAVVGGGGWAAYVRIGVGVLMLVSAIMLFSLRSGSVEVALNVGLAAALGILGLGLMVGPWLFRLSSDLSEEREARVRSEERADVAAHLHDSVLQTLALIQRSAGDGPTVSRLARAQERDLRSWLFADPAEEATTLAAALREAAAAVEDDHGVPVEVVCVGDAPLTDVERPLVLAAREAIANAARHSGAATIDVYAEATPSSIEVFVRDRGRGFDPASGGRGPPRRPQQHRRPDGAPRRHGRRTQPARRGHRGPAVLLPPDPRGVLMARSVVIVDDHAMFRTGVRAELASGGHGRGRRGGRGRRRRRGRQGGARSTSPRWCCSTCTCPAAAARRS